MRYRSEKVLSMEERIKALKIVMIIFFLTLLSVLMIFISSIQIKDQTLIAYNKTIDLLQNQTSELKAFADDMSCWFEICNSKNTLEYCSTLLTSCKQLKDRCYDDYYYQWSLNCSWNEDVCSCRMVK